MKNLSSEKVKTKPIIFNSSLEEFRKCLKNLSSEKAKNKTNYFSFSLEEFRKCLKGLSSEKAKNKTNYFWFFSRGIQKVFERSLVGKNKKLIIFHFSLEEFRK